METDKKILEKICEATDQDLGFTYDLLRWQDQYKIRGFLLDVDTARAVFGEEKISKKLDDNLYESADGNYSVFFIGKACDYHATKMVLLPDNHQILEYYDKYL